MTDTSEFGDRVRRYRERRGLTQSQAGGMMLRSADWWSKVERGLRPVDKMSNLVRMAEILEIDDLAELTGAPVSYAIADTPHHASVGGIRSAMLGLPDMRGAALPGGVLPQPALARRVEDAWGIYDHDKARYDRLGPVLPELIGQAYRTARTAEGDDSVAAQRSLISVHHLLQVYLKRLGEKELAWLAADRALTMASDLGDQAWIGASAWNLGAIALNRGDADIALQLAQDAIATMTPIPDDASGEYLSVYGALHLVAVIASARVGQSGRGWDYLRQAEAVARRQGGDANHFRTSFGPTNVLMHGVHLAGEEGDFTEALRLADDVDVAAVMDVLPLERLTRYLVELFQGHRLKGDRLGMLYTLKEIVGLSLVEAKQYSTVREGARDLIRYGGARHRAETEALASALGVIA
jgi:transcriptional regulator with XRE-family HTH domain